MLPCFYVHSTSHTTRVFYRARPQCRQPAENAKAAFCSPQPPFTRTAPALFPRCLLQTPSPLPAGVVFMAGNVYAVGGFNGSLRVRTVDVYDGVKDQWTSIASMQERRSTLGAAVLNDLLYAVGGFDGSTGR